MFEKIKNQLNGERDEICRTLGLASNNNLKDGRSYMELITIKDVRALDFLMFILKLINFFENKDYQEDVLIEQLYNFRNEHSPKRKEFSKNIKKLEYTSSGGLCRICNNGGAEYHHVMSRSDSSYKNCMLLCNFCHDYVDSRVMIFEKIIPIFSNNNLQGIHHKESSQMQ